MLVILTEEICHFLEEQLTTKTARLGLNMFKETVKPPFKCKSMILKEPLPLVCKETVSISDDGNFSMPLFEETTIP